MAYPYHPSHPGTKKTGPERTLRNWLARKRLGRGVTVILLASATAWAQAIRLDSVPAGVHPLGVDITGFATTTNFLAAVANSGSNSVSLYRLSSLHGTFAPKTLTPIATVHGIPSPYSVAACSVQLEGGMMLVKSPSQNSVRLIQVPDDTVVRSVSVGPQPYSAACYPVPGLSRLQAAVSNFEDSSLTAFDLATGNTLATIPGVPGSRGFHGIAVCADSTISLVAWVAGTDANVVTLVDLLQLKVLTQIPVSHPTAIRAAVATCSTDQIYISSADDNTITIYDRNTAQVIRTIEGVPNPQDFVNSTLGIFAPIGGQDALWRQDGRLEVSTVPGIPGAAALAAAAFGRTSSTGAVVVTSPDSNSVFLIQQLLPSPPDITIDIKPGDGKNTINRKSNGRVLVAILSSAEFDATTVDPASVTLAGGHVVTQGKASTPLTSIQDINHDGRVDLVLHFKTRDLQLEPDSTEAVLLGETFSGQSIRGVDSIRLVP